MMNNKIVFFINRLSGGGAEKVCITLLDEMNKKNMNIELVVLNSSGAAYEVDNIKMTSLGSNSIKTSIFKIKEYLDNNEFDKAIVFSYEISIILMLFKKIYKYKYIIFSRCINTISKEREYETSKFRKYIVHYLIKKMYKYMDVIISQSNGMTKDLVDNYNVEQRRICTINNPLSPKFQGYIGNIHNRTLEDEYILYMGRFEKQKGLFNLLDSFSIIKDKKINLVMVGNGSLKDEIIEYSKQLGVHNRVRFIDFSKNVEEFYFNAKLTVLSSFFEGFPNVLLESIACGTPVVSFDCPSGPEEIIIDGKNGFLAEYGNINDFANKIDKALKYDWSVEEIQNTAKRYNKEIIINKYIEILN